MSKRLTAQKYIEALDGTGGNMSEAARKLGVTRTAVFNAIQRYASVAEKLENEKEFSTDEAEWGITHNIRVKNKKAREEDEPIDTSDHKWWLSRMRREQFGESIDVTSGNKPLEIGDDKIAGYEATLRQLIESMDSRILDNSSEQDDNS